MPFDFLIDKNTGDIVFEDGDIALVSSNQRRVRQEIELTLKTFQGEWFHDVNFGGINKEILYSKTSTKSEVDAWFKSIITSFPEVVRLTSFESEYNINTRDYDVNFSVLTTEGPLDVKVRPDLEVVYRQFIAEIITPTCGAKIISAAITGESAMSVFIGTLTASGATITGESTLTALIGKSYANQAVTGDSTMNVGMLKVISASLGGFSTFSTNLYKNISVSSISGTSTFMSAIYSYIQSAIQGQATVTANIAKVIAAVINDNQSVLSATSSNAMGAIITGQATLTSTMMRVFSSTIADNNGAMTVSLSRLIAASLTGSDSSLNAIIRKRIESSINDNQGNVSANINRALSMVVSGQGTMTSSVRKLLSATLVEFPSDITVSISKPGASVIGGSDTSTFAIYKIKPISSAIVESPATFSAKINRVLQVSIDQSGEMLPVSMWPGHYYFYDTAIEDVSNRQGNYWKFVDGDAVAISNGNGWRDSFGNASNMLPSGNTPAQYPAVTSSPISRPSESSSVIYNESTSPYLIASGSGVTDLPIYTDGDNRHLVFFMQTPSSFPPQVGGTVVLQIRDATPNLFFDSGDSTWYGDVAMSFIVESSGSMVMRYTYRRQSDGVLYYADTYYNQLLSPNTRYHFRFTTFPGIGIPTSLYLNNVSVSRVAGSSAGWSGTRFYQCALASVNRDFIVDLPSGFKLERLAWFRATYTTLEEQVDLFNDVYKFAINPTYDKKILSLDPICYLSLDYVYTNNELMDLTQINYFETGRSVVHLATPISGYTEAASIPLLDVDGALAAGGDVGSNSLAVGNINTGYISDRYSVCFWHRKPDNIATSSTPYYLWRTIAWGNIPGIGYLQQTSTNYIFHFVNGNISVPLSAIPVNQDLFIVCKVNKSNQTASLWVNGQLVSSTITGANWSAAWTVSSELRIDSDYPSGVSYPVGTSGNAYERFSILPVDLTQAEIQELYRIGNKW